MQEAKDETDLSKAIARMDVPLTLRLALTGEETDGRELAKVLWASDALLNKRPSKNSTRREAFLEAIAETLEGVDAESAKQIRALSPILDVIDDGFAKILERTKRCEGSALAPVTQVSAALSFASKAADELEQAATRQALAAGPELRLQPNVSVDGQNIDPDTEMFGVLKSAVATIMMMAHSNRWFNDAEQVVLPASLRQASTREIDTVRSVLSFARAWLSWERAQLRIRLDQRPLEYLDKPFTEDVPAEIEKIIPALPNERIELTDFIANDRLLSRTKQHMVELVPRESGAGYPGLGRQAKLAPATFISFEEKLGLITLSEGYSFDVASDLKPYAGLRIVEWLRGYAVLMELAKEAPMEVDTAHECPQLREVELVRYLSRGGIPADRGRIFIQHCCLSKGRNDIYDRPLIRVEADRYLLVSASIRSALLGPIVMSAIAGVGAQVQRKGKAFESRLRKLLAETGDPVTSFTKKRNGQEYDYDALLLWGDFCFLFECKNRTLSGGILQLAHHAHRESTSHAAQVRRLVDGLLKYPDMLDADLPDARGKLLVPCVVNALPYAIPGGIDGVHFTDYSSLVRFFASPVIGEVGYKRGQVPQRTEDGEIVRMWAGDAPTPTDLLRHLECPFQYLLTRAHTGLRPILSGLSEQEAVMVGEYSRIDLARESGRAAARLYDAEFPRRSEVEWTDRLARIP